MVLAFSLFLLLHSSVSFSYRHACGRAPMQPKAPTCSVMSHLLLYSHVFSMLYFGGGFANTFLGSLIFSVGRVLATEPIQVSQRDFDFLSGKTFLDLFWDNFGFRERFRRGVSAWPPPSSPSVGCWQTGPLNAWC